MQGLNHEFPSKPWHQDDRFGLVLVCPGLRALLYSQLIASGANFWSVSWWALTTAIFVCFSYLRGIPVSVLPLLADLH